MRAYKVYAIDSGTVIDHIDGGKALKVVQMLGLNTYDKTVTVGIMLDSKKMGKKDIIKIENKNLCKKDLDKIALIAPRATINIIKDQKVNKKFNVNIPDEMIDLIICPNPKCISRNEKCASKFYRFSKVPLKLKCHYCERIFKEFELK